MPRFRVTVTRAQIVNGDLHRHVHFLAKRGDAWAVCGVMVFHSSEWERFCLICEVTSIEVTDEPTSFSSDATKTPAPK